MRNTIVYASLLLGQALVFPLLAEEIEIVIAPIADTYININDEINSDQLTLNTYTWPDNMIANTILMKFDLSAIPAGSSIESADLSLFLVRNDHFEDEFYTITAHKLVNVDPSFLMATGYTYDGENAWTANDCCYNGIPLAQADISPAYDTRDINRVFEYKTWSIASMVQEWFDEPSANFGVALNSDPSRIRDRHRYFASSRDPDPEVRPQLTIAYRPLLSLDPTSPITPLDATIEACASHEVFATLSVLPRNTAGSALPSGREVTIDEDPPRVVWGGTFEEMGPEGPRYLTRVGSNRCGGPRAITVRVDGISLETRPEVTFTCPPVALEQTRFSAEPSEVPADGESAASLEIRLVDTCDNPAFDRALRARPTRSDLRAQVIPEDSESDGEGFSHHTITAELAGQIGVEVEVDDEQMTSDLDLITFTYEDALAVGYSSTTQLGVAGQVVTLEATLANLYGGALVDIRLEFEHQGLSVLEVYGAQQHDEGWVVARMEEGASSEIRLLARLDVGNAEAKSRFTAHYRAESSFESGFKTLRSSQIVIVATGGAYAGGCECNTAQNGGSLLLSALVFLTLTRRRHRRARVTA